MGKFSKPRRKHVVDQGRKALFSILNESKNIILIYKPLCSIFDTYVDSILPND